MTYEDALLSPYISWDSMTQATSIPSKLYKYQAFFDKDGNENQYWDANMKGQFHMSLGCEFEDVNDCKPFFDKVSIMEHINNFLESLGIESREITLYLNETNNVITEKYFTEIISNYQNFIRVGCFTDDPDNNEMWNKYAFQKSGYCIEYDTQKNQLFSLSTLPVLYSDEPYDSSLTLANSIIVECYRNAKQYSEKEILERFHSIYEKIMKTAYIPVFIKQKQVWQFEREYRMFLLKNRTTRDGIIKAEDYLDSSYNIDLSKSVSAVHLGENFNRNKEYQALLDKVTTICQEKGIDLVYRGR